MSDQTSSDFAECIEWAADQEWSSGRIGLLGISYFGGTQWRVAARKPKGLACIIPWEGEFSALAREIELQLTLGRFTRHD